MGTIPDRRAAPGARRADVGQGGDRPRQRRRGPGRTERTGASSPPGPSAVAAVAHARRRFARRRVRRPPARPAPVAATSCARRNTELVEELGAMLELPVPRARAGGPTRRAAGVPAVARERRPGQGRGPLGRRVQRGGRRPADPRPADRARRRQQQRGAPGGGQDDLHPQRGPRRRRCSPNCRSSPTRPSASRRSVSTRARGRPARRPAAARPAERPVGRRRPRRRRQHPRAAAEAAAGRPEPRPAGGRGPEQPDPQHPRPARRPGAAPGRDQVLAALRHPDSWRSPRSCLARGARARPLSRWSASASSPTPTPRT